MLRYLRISTVVGNGWEYAASILVLPCPYLWRDALAYTLYASDDAFVFSGPHGISCTPGGGKPQTALFGITAGMYSRDFFAFILALFSEWSGSKSSADGAYSLCRILNCRKSKRNKQIVHFHTYCSYYFLTTTA